MAAIADQPSVQKFSNAWAPWSSMLISAMAARATIPRANRRGNGAQLTWRRPQA
jgi:hypothetical protein